MTTAAGLVLLDFQNFDEEKKKKGSAGYTGETVSDLRGGVVIHECRLCETSVIEGFLYSQVKIINSSFQSVFTRESNFIESCETAGQTLEKIEMDVAEVKKIIETEDVRKSVGPDGVSNWILRVQ